MPRKIYHVVGVKVGCTRQNIEARCQQQGLWEERAVDLLRIIPDHLSDKDAGDIEWFYSDSYGYTRGKHYSTHRWDLLMTECQKREARSKAGKNTQIKQFLKGTHISQTGNGGFQAMSSEKRSEAGRTGATTSNQIDRICPRCNRVGKGNKWLYHIAKGTVNCPLDRRGEVT
jgi:hypothetical protein